MTYQASSTTFGLRVRVFFSPTAASIAAICSCIWASFASVSALILAVSCSFRASSCFSWLISSARLAGFCGFVRQDLGRF